MICGHQIDPVTIGLQNITANSLKNENIILNTVKQSTICRGKPAEKEQRSTQFRLLQEWNYKIALTMNAEFRRENVTGFFHSRPFQMYAQRAYIVVKREIKNR